VSKLAKNGAILVASNLTNMLAGFISIPILIFLLGADSWADIAVAQAAGQILGIIVGYGWSMTGAAQVAGMPVNLRPAFFKKTFRVRAVLFSGLLPLLFLATYVLKGDNYLPFLLIAASVMMSGLGASWFYIGSKAPSKLLFLDVAPRVATVFLSLIVLWFGGEIVWFATIQLAGSVISIFIVKYDIGKLSGESAEKFSVALFYREIQKGRSAFLTAVTASAYVNAPVVIVAAFAGASAAEYILADKLLKLAQRTLGPLTQLFQGHIPDENLKIQEKRFPKAIAASLAVATVSATVYFLAVNQVALLISHQQVTISTPLAICFAACLFSVNISSVTGLVILTSLGKIRLVALSTLIGAITAFALIGALIPSLSSLGVAIAVASSEIVVMVFQIIFLKNLGIPFIRRRRSKDES
jgi:O-antigen/teichoic acid export membrane protein